MAFNQDDARERAMVDKLNLAQREGRARDEADGHTDVLVGGVEHRVLFECKSAPQDGDFGTGRDTGMRQLQRWSTMHFAFGWFAPRDDRPYRLWYGSPRMMRPWNQAEQEYLRHDLTLLEVVPGAVDDEVATRVLGDKDVYTYQDMRTLLKNQWNADGANDQPNLYRERADVRRGPRATDHLYSREVAVQAVRDRVRYLLARGGTVNNRKISASYVMGHCVELHPPRFANQLERALREELELEPPRVSSGG
ncbi:hypothetical protein [Vallicoccus soli]|uniref:Uncharacterized protein n=1 Tax=Vallicoccus soli TaxID=2339232 RepID=A0A3A3YPA1_9ACTN|nr:hypothetical protein [Vallicoccus soli]RJK92517.1 hypothetical protein D5H78_18745 [Vallicoccus soli]